MFVAFDPQLDWAAYDYVIIGAGVAGLFLAQKFAPSGRVLVLEAGGSDLGSAAGEGYYDLDVTGRDYAALGQRLSAFGGTSNHWGGHSHPISPQVFDNRPGFPGWPIAYADYALHLGEAQAWLNLGPFGKAKGTTGIERDLLAHAQNLTALHFQFSNPIRRFGDAPTQQSFANMAGVDIVLDTRVIDIQLAADGKRVEKLDLCHLPSDRRTTIPVKQLFLAAGGIENPRLMLWSARKYAAGNPLAGGPNALTGKFFMEHPSLSPVEIYVDARADIGALAPHLDADRMMNVVLGPTEAFLKAHDLTRFGMHFQDTPQPATDDIEIRAGEDFYVSRSIGYRRISPFFIFEQTPNQGSFVTLSQKLGKDGTPLARLNWYIPPEEIARYRKGVVMFCGLINQYGLAKARLVGDAMATDWNKLGFGNACHQMGTTRMAHNAAGGVVDANSKVFGLANMYIAGSSVFPSTDIVNPTLNLTALTARLANFVLNVPVVSNGATYRFGQGRDANAALGKGWSKPDFSGVWSDGDTAALTLERNGAKTLSLRGSANGQAQVELEINGASVFSGAANALSGKEFPAGDQDKLALGLHFSNIVSQKDAGLNDDTRQLGIFLQSVVLK
jgi:hypothetical protein